MEKLHIFRWLLKHGKLYAGFQKKPIFGIYHVWYDGDHLAFHFGWFYIGLSDQWRTKGSKMDKEKLRKEIGSKSPDEICDIIADLILRVEEIENKEIHGV